MQLARLDLRHVEEIADQAEQMRTGIVDAGGIAPMLGVEGPT